MLVDGVVRLTLVELFEMPTRTNTPENGDTPPRYDLDPPYDQLLPSAQRPRTGSPAASTSSNAASSSRAHQSEPLTGYTQLAETMRVPPPPKEKHRKQRLYTIDRRNICIYARDNPTKTQSEVAKEFYVDRSTVSKILKEKERWLHADSAPKIRVSKWR